MPQQGNPATDPELRDWSKRTLAEGGYLKPRQTADKMVKVLKEAKFKSGEHVDYYD